MQFKINLSQFSRFFILLLVGMNFFTTNSLGQESLGNLDFSRISYEKVIDFVESQKKSGHEHFTEIERKCYREGDSALYHKISSTFIIHAKTVDVWHEYVSITPKEAYKERIVGFGFLYSKNGDKITYLDDVFEGMQVGQMYFYNLKLLRGLINIAVAEELTIVDENLKTIRYCYLQNGKTEGSQEIRLISTADGNTEIIHDTWFKSYSSARDKLIYPPFHKKILKEYHHMIRERLEKTLK